MIWQYTGTIGSGKSYHALEDIISYLQKGKYVIANFPLKFGQGQIRRGIQKRFMYIPDEILNSSDGVGILYSISQREDFYEKFGEGACLVVIDEAGNFFPPEDHGHPVQKLWRKFFTQSRKLGYDFILVSQIDKQVNKVIRGCVEYEIKHRKANSIFPFNLLPFSIFIYVTYWKQQREKLKTDSSIFVKRFAAMYSTQMLFGSLDEQLEYFAHSGNPLPHFGNCSPDAMSVGGSASAEGPTDVASAGES